MYNYSFIIPHKNSPELLKRCVDSIPVRDDIQIIIVDDNSNDEQKPALPERKGLEIVQLDASQSKGAGKARNVGLDKAEGKWLLFADADDYYITDFLEVLDEYNDADYDIVYYNIKFVDTITGNELPPINISRYVSYYDGSEISEKKLKYDNNAPWSKMVKRSFVERYNIRFEEVVNGNDYLFSVLIASFCSEFHVVDRVVYIYTFNTISLTNKKHFTKKEIFCRLSFLIKRKSFLDYISLDCGRDSSIIIFLLYTLKHQGFIQLIKTLFVYISNTGALYKHRDYYIQAVRNRI